MHPLVTKSKRLSLMLPLSTSYQQKDLVNLFKVKFIVIQYITIYILVVFKKTPEKKRIKMKEKRRKDSNWKVYCFSAILAFYDRKTGRRNRLAGTETIEIVV